jgi:hypothetical protein
MTTSTREMGYSPSCVQSCGEHCRISASRRIPLRHMVSSAIIRSISLSSKWPNVCYEFSGLSTAQERSPRYCVQDCERSYLGLQRHFARDKAGVCLIEHSQGQHCHGRQRCLRFGGDVGIFREANEQSNTRIPLTHGARSSIFSVV